ncbi:MAG TPA: dynamin family protein [Polyangia bacterium]|nr:dynamin family protein [Polyangia bacterium]
MEPEEHESRSLLTAVAALAERAGAPGIREGADALRLRLAEGRFYVVCLGQFKRGKSTLLNALVGAAILPAGVAPVTSVVTVIRYGERIAARVRTRASDWREVSPDSLADYVSEDRNPGNSKGVTGVEVFAPAALLRKGLCLVDTPGIGSVFSENTAATHEFLPQVDAALAVLGADPPVTGDELALLQEVSKRVPHLVYVLAKADRLSDAERGEALIFTKRVLRQRLALGGSGPKVLEISAVEVRSSGEATRDWTSLVQMLEELAAKAGADLVVAAEQRGTANLIDRLLATIDEQAGMLERPLAESAERVAVLRRAVAEAERALGDLAPLFAAQEGQLLRRMESERDRWLRDTVPAAESELDTALDSANERGGALRERAVGEATIIARRRLLDWNANEAPEVDRLFRSAMQRFVELLASVERVLASGAGAGSGRSLAIEPALRASSQFYMTEMLATAPTSVGKQLLDTVAIVSERRTAAIRRDAREYLGRLLDVNSARLKNDFRERLAASRRSLESEVRHRLAEMATAADRALERARVLQAAGATGVAAELERLGGLRAEAERIRLQAKRG